jgi:hypothetical protein
VELLIAGGICQTADPSLLEALRAGGARILGRIGSTLDYYRQIAATVNPIGPSTGVKIKSVETLITGRSLITTRWGADAALRAAFPDQISMIDWPPEPAALGQVVAGVVRSVTPDGGAAAKAYVAKATQFLRELHSA